MVYPTVLILSPTVLKILHVTDGIPPLFYRYPPYKVATEPPLQYYTNVLKVGYSLMFV